MTAHGFRRARARVAAPRPDRPGAGATAQPDAERDADEWAILVRPRRSKREYTRQVAIDVVVVLVALVVVALLS